MIHSRNLFAAGRAALVLGFVLVAAHTSTLPAFANDPNECDVSGEVPDIVVADIPNLQRWGEADGITAFSIGTVSCNVGSCWANWISNSADHPVIAQNMFRYKDGRFEQIGQSWLKHGFGTLDGDACSDNCVPADGSHLGVNCSDPYSSTLNGQQHRMGPRFEVDPHSGVYPYPPTGWNETGDAIYKRLQVHNEDLDPELNPGATYFVDTHYVALDDATAGNNNNNFAYREIEVYEAAGEFFISPASSTRSDQPGLEAWNEMDTSVRPRFVSIEGDGELLLAAKATSIGDGMWEYEYALQNVTSHRAVGRFTVPIPAGATVMNQGFHDVDYHSGSPIDNTDWAMFVDISQTPNLVTWQTETFAQNPYANALRWGTMYNFRFQSDVAPVNGTITLGLFRPGTPSEIVAGTVIPDPDASFSGLAGAVPGDPMTPGPPLTVAPAALGRIRLNWGSSCLPSDTDYAVYEGDIGDFENHEPVLCYTEGSTTATILPDEGNTYYLVVPRNALHEGSYGVNSNLQERPPGVGACATQAIGVCP